jgi:predicted Abi (CAAX) family protease
MKYTIFISVLLLLFGGCQKCKKDPAPDPCLGYKPMSADFRMIQTLNPLSAEYPDWSKSWCFC